MSSWKQSLFTVPSSISKPQANLQKANSASIRSNKTTMAAAAPGGVNGPQGSKVI